MAARAKTVKKKKEENTAHEALHGFSNNFAQTVFASLHHMATKA